VDAHIAVLSSASDDSSDSLDEKKARECGLASKEEDVKIV
jgi:hypothetical protein